jgi:protein-S-isoprenylcysteine O-methyltransferase Ste14
MTSYGWLIFALWLTLVAYWALAARAISRSTGSRWIWWREIAVRLGLFALVVLVLQVAVIGHALPNARLYGLTTTSMSMGRIGFLLALLGIGLAILGRDHLSRDRATPRSNEENPALVTSGPYALVRHPIYGGMLLAMLGSAIGQSVLWLLPLVVYGPYFLRSARREEARLIERFPEHYRAYMKRTKMLLPFVV